MPWHEQPTVPAQMLLILLLAGAASGQIMVIEDHPGIDQSDSGVMGSQPPPDPDLTVSPGEQTGEVVQVVNRLIRVWDRNPFSFKDEASLADFFGNLPGQEPLDPRVIYDPVEDRFIVSALAGSPRQLVVAVSPMGGATPLLVGNQANWSLASAIGEFTDLDTKCSGGSGTIELLRLDQPRIARTQFAWVVAALAGKSQQPPAQDNAIYFIDKEPEIGPGGEEIFTITGPIFTSTFPDPLGPGGFVGCDSVATAGAEIITPARDADTDIAYFAGLEWNLFPDSTCENMDEINSLRLFAVEDPLGAGQPAVVTRG